LAPGPGTTPAAAPPSTTPLTPLTTLLQRIVPAAAAVLGEASWFDAPPGTCAHRDLPLGTIVKVTRTSNGASTTCRVADRGPSLQTNRVIDLSLDTFEKLASSDAGVINVRIEW
jgi:rare lipoprotein A (peptidoglycan hydrolase)